MSTSIRAKFKVNSITRTAGWNGVKELHTIKLSPVIGDTPENKSFYGSTPSGNIDLSVVHAAIGNQFDIGQEFFVDFTPAPTAAPST